MGNSPHVDFWTGLIIWNILTLIFGLGLWLGVRITGIEIKGIPFAVVVAISSLATLVPVLGQILCYLIAAFLLYRLTDAELPHVLITVTISRGLVMLMLLGIYAHFSNLREAQQRQYEAKQLQMILGSQAPTNSTNPAP